MDRDNENNVADRPNIYQRLNRVRQALITKGSLQKDSEVKTKSGGKKFDYVSHDAVTAWINAEFCLEGIECDFIEYDHVQHGNRTELKVDVIYINVDNPEDRSFYKGSLGYGNDDYDFGPGKAQSYAIKKAHLKKLGLNSFENQEGEAVEYAEGVSAVEHEKTTKELKKSQKRTGEISKQAVYDLRDKIVDAGTVAGLDVIMSNAKSLLTELPETTLDFISDLEETTRDQIIAMEEREAQEEE